MRLLIITNIPTPYRINFFNTLHGVLQQSAGGHLRVLYCAKNEPNRHWDIDLNHQNFEYKILRGIHATIGRLFLHFNPSVIRETLKYKPDVIIYAGSWNMPTLIYSMIYHKMFKSHWKSLFWSEGHDGAVHYTKGIIPHLRVKVLNLFDGFAVPNKRSENFLFSFIKVKSKPIVYLPNTVDVSFYTKPIDWSDEQSLEAKKKYSIPQDSKIFLQIAQVDNRKSAKELVLFWEKVDSRTKQDCVLVLAGDGDLRAELIQYVIDKKINDIFILGHLSKNEVRELLFSSAAFVLLTKNDPNPLTLIEASFAGLPILTTKYAGNCNELVFEGKNGIVLDEIDFLKFENSISKIIGLIETQNKSQFSKRNAEINFDTAIISKNLIEQINLLFK